MTKRLPGIGLPQGFPGSHALNMHLLPILPLSAFHLLVSVTWLRVLAGFATTLQAVFWCRDAARCSLNVTRRNILPFLAVPLQGLITECLDKVSCGNLFHCLTPSVHTVLPLPGHVPIPKLKWFSEWPGSRHEHSLNRLLLFWCD